MKAVVYTKYGSPDVLEFKEIEIPKPKEYEVLVKIHASSVNAADWHLLRADPFLARFGSGLFKPKLTILGADIAGTVEAVGSNAKQFKPGDEVFGDLSQSGWGGFAEYTCANENALALKPKNLSFDEAASVPLAGITALQGLRDKGQIKEGSKVLINGAAGGVGTFAVQIAKSFGAEVTAVCSSGNLATLKSIGADYVIDYEKQNFTQKELRYNLIIAANGYHPILDYKRVLEPGGVFVMIGGATKQMFQALLFGSLLSLTGNKKMRSLLAKSCQKDIIFLKELLESGKIKPVIDRKYTLKETADAIRYIETGHAKGKVVITCT